VVKEIVAESSPEHFPSSAEPFFGHGGFSQEVQSRFSQYIEIFRGTVRSCPARVFPQNTRPETSAGRSRLTGARE
jgi:hypothetical protein